MRSNRFSAQFPNINPEDISFELSPEETAIAAAKEATEAMRSATAAFMAAGRAEAKKKMQSVLEAGRTAAKKSWKAMMAYKTDECQTSFYD